MNLIGETALLEAVVNRLREYLDLTADEIDIEIDDESPAMIGQTYYCVIPNAGSPGRSNDTMDQSFSHLFGVRVCVLERITPVPRDRRRSVFIDQLESINKKLTEVTKAIRFSYDLINDATAIVAETGNYGKFITPLRTQGMDTKPQTVVSDIVGAKSHSSGDAIVVMKRGVNFGNAEFVGKWP